MDDNSKMTNVPAKYLIWLYENDKCNDELYDYIVDNYTDLLRESDLELW